jgi:hypothetical protein
MSGSKSSGLLNQGCRSNIKPDYAPCSAILSVVQIANIIDFRGVF